MPKSKTKGSRMDIAEVVEVIGVAGEVAGEDDSNGNLESQGKWTSAIFRERSDLLEGVSHK